ncbi:hypothetical protein ACQ4M4_03655 [Leptolyngbya sp. AN02str]|uniref:hypothetical protein n=1 Tax=Leptolyngbya sp. AN02str TaxID=3423363 RepID=UPI003D31FEEB
MRKPFLSIALSLSAVFVAGGIPVAKHLICSPAAWAQTTQSYGEEGQSGSNGRSGRAGSSGSSRTIFANGLPQQLELVGTDGEDGESGRNGRSALCGRQPRDVDYNLRAPNGGHGGNGGNGGDGGDGGSVTIYYTNLADVRQVYVNAAAGRAGRGGLGGQAGPGCNCDRRFWEIETCTGTPGTADYRCSVRRFTCTDGSNGRVGSNGNNGRTGTIGELTLINRAEPLSAEQPQAAAPLSQLLGQSISLSKDLWDVRQGATGLLAPGSVVANEYREYAGRVEATVQLVWQAARSRSEFANETATVTLERDRQVQVDFSDEIWADGTQVTDANQLTTYTIANVIRRNEATQMDTVRVAGSGRDLQFTVVDQANVSDLVATEFAVQIRTADGQGDRRPDYRTRFEGVVPANLVTQDGNRFVLNLGQLPISARDLAAGNPAEIRLTATRSFAGQSAETSMNWRGNLRR